MRLLSHHSDDDCCDFLSFDDGKHLVLEEKAAVLLDTDGTVLKRWWKEEPSGDHWDAYLQQVDTVPIVDRDPATFGELCYEATRAEPGVVVKLLKLLAPRDLLPE